MDFGVQVCPSQKHVVAVDSSSVQLRRYDLSRVSLCIVRQHSYHLRNGAPRVSHCTPTLNSNLGIAHIGDTISSVEIPISIISL